MIELTQEQFWLVTAVTSAASFALGLLVPRFWMTRKERKDVEQTNFKNTTELMADHTTRRDTYIQCLRTYTQSDEVSENSFVEIMTTGLRYFDHVSFLCDAILSDKLDAHVRDNTILPKIRGVADKTLPLHYKTLSDIAKKKGYPYTGELRRSDYQGIFAVAEKFNLIGD